jgi:hypothetical protein
VALEVVQSILAKDRKMISILIVALLLICLTFSLWLNFRLSHLLIFYAKVPTRPSPPFIGKGLEYQNVPIVPIVLKWMTGHYKDDPILSNLAGIGKRIERAKNAQ